MIPSLCSQSRPPWSPYPIGYNPAVYEIRRSATSASAAETDGMLMTGGGCNRSLRLRWPRKAGAPRGLREPTDPAGSQRGKLGPCIGCQGRRVMLCTDRMENIILAFVGREILGASLEPISRRGATMKTQLLVK